MQVTKLYIIFHSFQEKKSQAAKHCYQGIWLAPALINVSLFLFREL
jgi:hypothetical protein